MRPFTLREKTILFIGTLLIGLSIVAPNLYAQLGQSGGPGSTVTIGSALPAGSAIIGKVTTDQTTHGTSDLVAADLTKVGGTAIAIGQQLASASLPVILPAATITTLTPPSAVGLNAGTNTIGIVIPKTPCGTTVANQVIAAVPTSATAVFSATTCLMHAFFNNTNSGTQTVTLTDNAGTPLNVIGPAFVIPGLSFATIDFNGVQFSAGVKWTAGGTGVTGGMWGFQ
jgi:hypothetical protein